MTQDGRCRGASSFTLYTLHRMISAAHPARNDGATEECAEYARKSDSNVQLHTLSALRLSSVRAPGARAPGAVHTSSYWARGTHGPRQSSRLNTHTVSSCTVSIPAVWTVAVSARHFIPYTDCLGCRTQASSAA